MNFKTPDPDAPDDADLDPSQGHDTMDAPEVPMGQVMPEVHALPVLSPQIQAAALPADGPARHSTLSQHMCFVGAAVVEGSLTIAGEVAGELRLTGPSSHVTVTESGVVDGDLVARNISVLGRTNGLLDAAGGKVSLHGSASVSGRIRYTHLQVNGADLNAQLERVRPESDGSPSN